MVISTAIRDRQLLSFNYDGYGRLVEPHTYGIDSRGHPALRAFQVPGGSESGETTGWKIFHVQQMQGTSGIAQTFAGPRPGYKRDDKAFRTIHAQL